MRSEGLDRLLVRRPHLSLHRLVLRCLRLELRLAHLAQRVAQRTLGALVRRLQLGASGVGLLGRLFERAPQVCLLVRAVGDECGDLSLVLSEALA